MVLWLMNIIDSKTVLHHYMENKALHWVLGKLSVYLAINCLNPMTFIFTSNYIPQANVV